MNVLKILASSSFLTINIELARIFGLNEATVLAALCSEKLWCEKKGEISNGYFPMSMEKMKSRTTLGEKPQRTTIKNLCEAGVLDQKNLGMPSKRHFYINERQLEYLLNGETSSSQTQEQDSPDGRTYNNIYQYNTIKNNVEEYTESIPTEELPEDEMFRQIIQSWNEQSNIKAKITKIPVLSRRYSNTLLTIKEHGFDAFLKAIWDIDKTEFFSQWQPTYDWFSEPNNFLKVIEGNYKEKETDKEWLERWLNDEE